MMTIDVRTTTFREGAIISELILDAGTAEQRIIRSAIYTQELQVREGLIRLGWTPPDDATTDSASRAHAFGC